MPELRDVSVRTYNRIELNKIPVSAKFDNSYWEYFLILEKRFDDSLQYVQLCEDNLKTYSLDFANQIVSISTEFETIAKLLCSEISGAKPGNIGEYKKIILEKYPNLWSNRITIDKSKSFEYQPLAPWEKPSGNLSWWDGYVKIKHNRHNYFKQATLENVINSLGSLMILEIYLYRTAYGAANGLRYGTRIMRINGLAQPIYIPKGNLPDLFDGNESSSGKQYFKIVTI